MAKETCPQCGWGLGARDNCETCVAARPIPREEIKKIHQYLREKWGPDRPPREQTYLEICHVLAKRSTCLRGHVGAVLVVDRRIVATGYNGAPPGLPHCLERGCDVDPSAIISGCQRAVHAEANVVAFAARTGQRTEGSTLYCTHGPCRKCAQLLVSAGIQSVIYEVPYRLTDGLELLGEAGVKHSQYSIEGVIGGVGP